MNPSSLGPNLQSPPQWADRVLRLFVGKERAESVSGDLLEEYRDSICPARGAWRADIWFVRQVAGFAWRSTGSWAIALAVFQLGRDMLDWYMPPLDYTLRSAITTYSVAGLFIALGCRHAWKTRSLPSSALAAVVTGISGAVLKAVGIILVLILWNDTKTEFSGGLAEALELPWIIILPATLFAIAGGLIGKAAVAIIRPTSPGRSR